MLSFFSAISAAAFAIISPFSMPAIFVDYFHYAFRDIFADITPDFAAILLMPYYAASLAIAIVFISLLTYAAFYFIDAD
jgi:hypothetical protein